MCGHIIFNLHSYTQIHHNAILFCMHPRHQKRFLHNATVLRIRLLPPNLKNRSYQLNTSIYYQTITTFFQLQNKRKPKAFSPSSQTCVLSILSARRHPKKNHPCYAVNVLARVKISNNFICGHQFVCNRLLF